MRILLSTVAAIAIAATAAQAEPGGGKGGGQGKGGGGGKEQAGRIQGGGNAGGKEARGNSAKSEVRGQGQAKVREERGRGNDVVREARGDSGRGKAETRDDRRRGNDDFIREARGRGNDRGGDVRGRVDRDGRVVRDDRGRFDWDDFVPARSRGLIAGCPPGLAKKNNGCRPPGLARQSTAAFWDRPDWWGFDDSRWFDRMSRDGRYRFTDGYLVRYDGNGVAGWLPLLGGALAPGNAWPSMYAPVSLPAYYQDYYGLGPAGGYRYYDDALYRVDPQTQAITSIAGLLTGDPFAVGQSLPPGYDVYNVPYSYRDRYADGPDASYRYSDGYVYQVDPTTQLIQAAIQLLT